MTKYVPGVDELKLHVEVSVVVEAVSVMVVQDVARPMVGFGELVNDTAPVKPFSPVTRMLLSPVEPLGKLTLSKRGARLKSAGDSTLTRIETKWSVVPLLALTTMS